MKHWLIKHLVQSCFRSLFGPLPPFADAIKDKLFALFGTDLSTIADTLSCMLGNKIIFTDILSYSAMRSRYGGKI